MSTDRNTSPTRNSYVQKFGEEEALAIEEAAIRHVNEYNSANKGSDLFRWAICIVIGYQCAEIEAYREEHRIKAPWGEIRQWIKREGDLANHDGDLDYLALCAGVYDEYVEMVN